MTTQLENKLIERGYSYKASEIKEQINSIKFENKQTILSDKPIRETNPVVIPIKYNNNSPTIKQTVLGNWHLISSDPILKQFHNKTNDSEQKEPIPGQQTSKSQNQKPNTNHGP